jgi:oligopeptide transport system substrate-binding protein
MFHRVLTTLLKCLAVSVLAIGTAAGASDPDKVLRVAMPDIETLDPHQYSDDPSFQVLRAIFEGMYEWDYLASPARLSPLAAVALPEITDDGKTWTMRLKPGIYFTPDPAFNGKPRELVAADYVYSLKRWLDPNLHRGGAPINTDLIVGARAIVDAAAHAGGKFDYDLPMEGLREIDRYTVQLKLTQPNYPVIESYIVLGAVAREVVEAAGGDIRTRVVGTGPYRLREWKRGSRIVLEANPGYRTLQFPGSDDPRRAALVRSMRGKSFPQIGFVEISVIEEDVTRLLEFDRGRLDYVVLRGETANRMLANGALRPEYAARGITRQVQIEPFLFSIYFNMNDPQTGGMTTERVALRRAIALGLDVANLVKVVYAGQAMPANQLVPPGVTGHDPALPARGRTDPAAARALLDRVGYRNLDAEGCRMTPDGKPLTLTLSLRSGAISREVETQWKRDMSALGLRTAFHVTPFQEVIKELDGGKFQIYFGGYGGEPSAYAVLMQLYGKQPPTINSSRFKFAEYDRMMEEYLRSPSESGQRAAARKMSAIAGTYVPLLPMVFRFENYFVQSWLTGLVPPAFDNYWKYLDLDPARRKAAGS